MCFKALFHVIGCSKLLSSSMKTSKIPLNYSSTWEHLFSFEIQIYLGNSCSCSTVWSLLIDHWFFPNPPDCEGPMLYLEQNLVVSFELFVWVWFCSFLISYIASRFSLFLTSFLTRGIWNENTINLLTLLRFYILFLF